MVENQTLMQYFEWYLPSDGNHWERLAQQAQQLKEIGIDKIWLPPAFKATSVDDVGYGVYDLFDLGEFNQKGTVRTKYGTKVEYINAIQTLQAGGIECIADVVLNHKASADYTERFSVLQMDPMNRQEALGEPYEIEGWTHFTFPGRQGMYNDFEWHWYHFTGTDFDATTNESGIYMILGENKGWANNEDVDSENGNYDYLMYADIDFKHPEVIENIYQWAEWFIETTGISGFRLDAVKHIDAMFMQQFIRWITEQYGESFYVFGEYWQADSEKMAYYLNQIEYQFDLVDVRLHHNFFNASQAGADYDLRGLFDGTLMQLNPTAAVTFVDNHDTQRGQALESTVAEWFKPLAYATILLREQGLPCVFYGDYYGIEGEFSQQSFQSELNTLLWLRKNYAYGEQIDYLDDATCIGWVRLGNGTPPLVTLLNTNDSTQKSCYVGEDWAHQTFYNPLTETDERIVINEEGYGEFSVASQAVAVWIPENKG